MSDSPRTPQDHKPKTKKVVKEAAVGGPIEPLVYVALDGSEHLVDGASLVDKLSPGWFRRNRGKNALDATFTMVELVADQALLDALDASWQELNRFGEEFEPYWEQILGASMGESSAS